MDPEADNFYAAPQAEVHDPGYADGNAEGIRREHVLHEASIKSVGCLFLLGGLFSVLWGGGVLIGTLLDDSGGDPDFKTFALIAGPIVLVLGGLNIAVGKGLRTFSAGAKIPAVVLSALSILSFPCGTALGAYTMYLLLSAKGAMVFSEDYKDVIAATPHIKARTPWYAWVALLGLVLLILLGVVLGGVA